MDPVGAHDLQVQLSIICGQRSCPNTTCNGHLFIVFDRVSKEIIAAYPPVKIDFNPENLPSNVLNTFEEAISCFANSHFIAAAIMVRRTLEEVCLERGASGDNLKKRITDLQTKVIMPKELLEAMHELRILGNNAAHVTAQEYNNVSHQELQAAIELTKEILKALYQYGSLLAQLRALKG